VFMIMVVNLIMAVIVLLFVFVFVCHVESHSFPQLCA
jgi:hypothetical protein